MKFGVVTFPGSNCDKDIIYVLEQVMGQQVVQLWHKEHDLQGVDFVILPGGFSYGDYLRSGAIARFSPIMQEVIQFAGKGGYVMGICNGFQILTEAGLVPGALLHNMNRKFICRNIYLKPATTNTLITSGLDKNRALEIPIAHGEGNYFADSDTLKQLYDNDQVLFRYCDEAGNVSQEANPNGSIENIAGVCNANRNVFGMMPHPERAADTILANQDGIGIFDSILKNGPCLMTNLVIDIGNTLTKIAVFNDRQLVDIRAFDDITILKLEEYLAGKIIDQAIISTVSGGIPGLETLLKKNGYRYFQFNTRLEVNVRSSYRTQETLGPDRYAGVIGAATTFPARNCLVVDAGTCITYDFIDSDRNYYGGSIAPGLKMRFQSLHAFTDRLPLIEPDTNFTDLTGDDTRTSILSGIQTGIVHEIKGFIQLYSDQYSDLLVVLCGGDVNFFDSQLKNSIFADAVKTEPNLVLIGLNEVIYQQND